MSSAPLTILLLMIAATPVVNDANRSRIEVTTSVSRELDSCLDHSVKELGMSAKRQGEARLWNIAPQFLHPTIVPDGTVQVRFETAQDGLVVRITASWPGPLKPADVQPEMENRLRAMTTKIAQICGVTRPSLTCATVAAGGSTKPCAAVEN